jgi:hypothetical protein
MDIGAHEMKRPAASARLDPNGFPWNVFYGARRRDTAVSPGIFANSASLGPGDDVQHASADARKDINGCGNPEEYS